MREPPHILITGAPEDEKRALSLWARLNHLGLKADIWPIRESSTLPKERIQLESSVTHLVVFCSPSAANNFLVSQAIATFLTRNPSNNILPVLSSTLQTSAGVAPSYPAMLRQIRRNGLLEEIDPPKAISDIRSGTTSTKQVAVDIAKAIGFKLHSKWPILTRQKVGGIIAASLFVFIGISSFSVSQFIHIKKIKQETLRADNFSNEMLITLENKLTNQSRREVFSILGDDIINAVQSNFGKERNTDNLTRLSRLLYLIGDARKSNSDYPGAIKALTLAHQVTGDLLARSPEDLKLIFNHSQSAYWIGNAALANGDFQVSKRAFAEYEKYSKILVHAAPANEKYKAELAYSYNNSSIVLLYQGEVESALSGFQVTLQLYNDGLVESGAIKEDSLANVHAWLATTSLALGDFRAAKEYREKEIRILSALLEVTPKNRNRRLELTAAKRNLSDVLTYTGQIKRASALLAEIDIELTALNRTFPDNVKIRRYQLAVFRDRSQISLWNKNFPLAQMASQMASNIYVSGPNAAENDRRDTDNAAYNIVSAKISLAIKNYERALSQAAMATNSLERSVSKGKSYNSYRLARAYFLQGEALNGLGRSAEAERAWRTGLSFVETLKRPRDRKADDIHSRILWRLNDATQAEELRIQLIESGYRYPDFINFWNSTDEPDANIASLQTGER